MLHVRLRFRFLWSAAGRNFPVTEAAFVTEQTTRLVFPSHIEAVADAAAAATDFARECGLSEEAVFGMDMAVREAITNAVVHGNKEDESKEVEVSFNCSRHAIEIEVKDQGAGFDPAVVPDPTAPENRPRSAANPGAEPAWFERHRPGLARAPDRFVPDTKHQGCQTARPPPGDSHRPP